MKTLLFFLLLLTDVYGSANSDVDEKFSLYTEVTPANKSDSLNRIKNVPIVLYKFKYDSVQDRNIMGMLGPEAQRWFPESIDVVPTYTIPNKDRSKSNIVLTNFPVVDKNVLFMHGIVALQALIERYESMEQIISSMESTDAEISSKYKEIDDILNAEVNKQYADKLMLAELENQLSKKQYDLEILRNEEDRTVVTQQLIDEKRLLEYQSELTRTRMRQEEDLARENLKELLSLEKELAEKRELMRRNTAEQLQTLKLQQISELDGKKLAHEKEKIVLEIETKAAQDRAGEEIAIRKIQIQSSQDTARMLEGIKAVGSQLTGIVRDLFSRPKQILSLSALLLVLLLCYYLVKESLTMLRVFIQSQIGKPSLVRETSRQWSIIPEFISSRLTRHEPISTTFKSIADSFEHIILSKEDKERVINLAVATRNTRRSGAPYRHILLHGPPGTGKTLIARKLAQVSGLDYAIMSGGDVAPLGEEAVTQLHSLFKWAARSRKGLLVFIDEAEAFLAARGSGGGGGSGGDSSGGGDAHMRNALNALLYQTGMPSTNFMLVLATNRPEDLDAAVLDRVDISLQISLPGLQQRIDLVQYYMRHYVLSVVQSAEDRHKQLLQRIWRSVAVFGRSEMLFTVDEACLSEETLSLIAIQSHGFSGREIAKLFIAVQYAMHLAEEQRLTLSLFRSTVDVKIRDHQLKSNGFVSSGSGVVGGKGDKNEKNHGAFESSERDCGGVKSQTVVNSGRSGNKGGGKLK